MDRELSSPLRASARRIPCLGALAFVSWLSSGCDRSETAASPGNLEPPGGSAGAAQAGGQGGKGREQGAGGAGAAGVGASAGSAVGGAGGAGAPGVVGVVVIDVQKTFVSGSVTPDIDGVMARTKGVFEKASEQGVPFFLTYEASKQGDHALDAALQPAMPPQAQEFIKTTFAATGLPAFAKAIGQAGLSHALLLGSETDVCVLQTALGLRGLGLTVLLQRDAVFTSESNPSPALRRMEQAGVLLVDQTDAASYLGGVSPLPKAPSAVVRLLSPLQVGVVLHGFSEANLSVVVDPLKKAKDARLRELLLVSEWFELPVYVEDVAAGLPAAYQAFFQGELRPVSQIADDASVTQLVVAGTDAALAGSLSSWASSHELFVVEDALLSLGTKAQQKQALAPFFEQGLVPTTYKSFYYEMTHSVSESEWPSKAWVDRFDPFFWLTKAPEDLPPMPED